jgi:hypothetical protein
MSLERIFATRGERGVLAPTTTHHGGRLIMAKAGVCSPASARIMFVAYRMCSVDCSWRFNHLGWCSACGAPATVVHAVTDARGAVPGRSPGGGVVDVTPVEEGMNVRTRVHEYGGGDYVLAGDCIAYSNFRCAWEAALGTCVSVPLDGP